MNEPRTNAEILRDLLYYIVESKEGFTARSYECDYDRGCEYHCVQCGGGYNNDCTDYVKGKSISNVWHKPDCTLNLCLEEARAYLRVENSLRKEKGEEELNIP